MFAAGAGESMIACRSLYRVNIFVRESSVTCVRSKPLLYFQNQKFWHGFSCDLKMDARKGGGDSSDRRKRTNVTQTWRAVSTQPNFSEGDGERAKLKNPLGEVQHATSSSTSIAEKHSVSMEIGASLMRFVKGKWGITQKKLEEENDIKIIFPSSRTEDSIIIEGNSAESVAQASEKIQSLIDKVVNSREFDYSHFISLPLAFNPELIEKLFNFQKTVLGIAASDKDKNLEIDAETSSKLADLGIEKSMFINPKTFHLTVLMLKLWNKERVKTASEVLQNVSSKVLDALENRPVSIGLKGLDCMKGSPAKAYVVYAPVEVIGGERRLLSACKVIKDAFVEAGLVMEKDAQQQLKLHATLMNARHRKRNTGTRNVDWFDARHIFEMYGSEEWGEYPIREAHLSQRFVYDDNRYYHCCASIPFPESIK